MNRVPKSVAYAEMQKHHKTKTFFAHFDEVDEKPDTFKFYFQHNNNTINTVSERSCHFGVMFSRR